MFSNKRKAKQDELRKKHLIRNWIAGFAVTAVVAVTQIISPSVKPSAVFDRIGSFEDSIYYDVTVLDTANVIIPDTLKIQVNSQYSSYEYPLTIGQNSGVIQNLRENTVYDVLIVGSEGYGLEILTKEKLTTKIKDGGAILNAKLMTTDLSEYELIYDIYTQYRDESLNYESVTLKYCIIFHEGGEIVPDECMDFQEVPINDYLQITSVVVPNYNTTVHLILEAVKTDQSVLILDEYQFKTPLMIDGYLYIDEVYPDAFTISGYVDYTVVQGIAYSLELYQNDVLVSEKEFIKPSDVPEYDSSSIRFDGLNVNTDYVLKLYAQYPDPLTEEYIKKELDVVNVKTTPHYSVSVTVTENIETYQISIEIDDPSNILHQFYYTVYDMSEGYPMYLSEEPIQMFISQEGLKTAVFELMIPTTSNYQIVFRCDKVINAETTYYYQSFYEINHYGG